MTTPRLRTELQAHPAEEQGIKFFDVSDSRSGATMRLYDFEWLLAQQMDGKRSLDEIARWAKGALHIDVTPQQLEQFSSKLSDLAFFDASTPAPALDSEADSEEVPLDLDELPTTQQPTLNPPSGGGSNGFDDSADTTVRATLPPPPEAFPPSRHEEVTKEQPALPRVTALPPTAPSQATPTRGTPIAALDALPQKKSGSGSIAGLIVVLLVVAAVVGYVMFLAPTSAKVSITVAKPGEVVRTYDGSAKLEAAPAKSMAFGEAGKVVDVIAAGAEVKAGMTLATLDAYTKVEKDLADVKDRLGFYQKALETAQAKSDAAATKAASDKVDEKKKALADLEARAGKLRLVAPGPGVVDKVLVTAGGDAKADAPAIELNDKRSIAVFKLPADAKVAVGDDVSLQVTGGATIAGKVSKIDGGATTVELGDGAAATGDAKLVKSKLAGVITLPATAVVKKNGADVVYTLSEGAVHEKKVTIADHSATDVYVTSGVTGGESVVSSGGDKLTDGQKAAVAP